MGRAYQQKGDLESAIRAYRTGVEVSAYPELLVALGQAIHHPECDR
jgi:cytochrome c-type biogenesis protein CcmH/NrfG